MTTAHIAMLHPAKFQFESLSYQSDAVDSIVRVFEGTPLAAAADLAGNQCPLSWAQISANLQSKLDEPKSRKRENLETILRRKRLFWVKDERVDAVTPLGKLL